MLRLIALVAALSLHAEQVSAFERWSTRYVYVSSSMTWAQANSYCSRNFQTQLATIRNSAENEEARRHNGGKTWFGLNDRARERTWAFLDGTPVRFTRWSPGEPNNKGNEDCAEIYGKNGRWNDEKCGSRRPFLCNRPTQIVSANYIYVFSPKSWRAANYFCKVNFGTTLAGIPNSARNIEARNLRKKDAWFGLNDRAGEKRWVNEDGTRVSYTYWDRGEPNNKGRGEGEDCAELYGNGRWNDEGCHEAKPFLCNRRNPHFLSTNFIYVPLAKNWQDANAYCHSKFRTTLANIDNIGQNNEARALRQGNAWFGLNDRRLEKRWEYLNGATPAWTNWAPGEPNNVGSGEDCAEIYADGRWNDNNCGVARPFLCNRRVRPRVDFSANFVYVGLPLTWSQANAYCVSHFKTSLASIGSVGRNNEARSVRKANAWFGLNDRSSERRWVNADRSRVTFRNWAPGEPNNAGNNEDCAEIYADGRWNDNNCNVKRTFLCNRRPPLPNYVYVPTPLSWPEANAYCRSKFGTTLATISNAPDNIEANGIKKTNFWIGLADFAQEKKWVWADGSKVVYSNWQRGQPDNLGACQDCGMMSGDGKWYDMSCKLQKAFLCNRKQPESDQQESHWAEEAYEYEWAVYDDEWAE